MPSGRADEVLIRQQVPIHLDALVAGGAEFLDDSLCGEFDNKVSLP